MLDWEGNIYDAKEHNKITLSNVPEDLTMALSLYVLSLSKSTFTLLVLFTVLKAVPVITVLIESFLQLIIHKYKQILFDILVNLNIIFIE